MHMIFQQYEERLSRRDAKPNTLKNLRRTAELFEESGLDPLTAEDWQLEEWLAGLRVPRTNGIHAGEDTPGLSARTVQLHYENLCAVYGYAFKRRQVDRDPTDDIRLPRIPDQEPKIIKNADLRAMLGRCTSDDEWLLAHLAIYTGMRKAELQNLKWEDCTPTSLRVTAGKGDKLRHVPVHPALSEVLLTAEAKGLYVIRGRKHDRPMSPSGVAVRLARFAGDDTFHDFRRTIATSLYKNGVVGETIDKILGWAPRTVRMRYYVNLAETDELQEAILQLYADDPLAVGALELVA